MDTEKGSSKDFVAHCSASTKPMPEHFMSNERIVSARISCVAASDLGWLKSWRGGQDLQE